MLKRILATLLLVLVTSPAYPWTASLNFRSTTAGPGSGVTDGAGETKVISGSDTASGTGEEYPVPRSNGTDTLTFGWLESTAETRDRSATPGAHFAGVHFNGANLNTFQLALPCAGTVAIKIAAGDYSNGFATNKVEIFDDTTSKLVLNAATSANQFNAQDGSQYSDSTWGPVDAVDFTFATTTLLIKVGNNAAGATGVIAHFEASMTCAGGSTMFKGAIGGGLGGKKMVIGD